MFVWHTPKKATEKRTSSKKLCLYFVNRIQWPIKQFLFCIENKSIIIKQYQITDENRCHSICLFKQMFDYKWMIVNKWSLAYRSYTVHISFAKTQWLWKQAKNKTHLRFRERKKYVHTSFKRLDNISVSWIKSK